MWRSYGHNNATAYIHAHTHTETQIDGTVCDLWSPLSLNPAGWKEGGEKESSNLRT